MPQTSPMNWFILWVIFTGSFIFVLSKLNLIHD